MTALGRRSRWPRHRSGQSGCAKDVPLELFLAEFIEHHRGLRIGRMFGLPAGYAGRRMFVCLIEDGLIVKLPPSVAKDELRAGNASPFVRRGRPSRLWVKYAPRTAREAGRLAPILEMAVRHVVSL